MKAEYLPLNVQLRHQGSQIKAFRQFNPKLGEHNAKYNIIRCIK